MRFILHEHEVASYDQRHGRRLEIPHRRRDVMLTLLPAEVETSFGRSPKRRSMAILFALIWHFTRFYSIRLVVHLNQYLSSE